MTGNPPHPHLPTYCIGNQKLAQTFHFTKAIKKIVLNVGKVFALPSLFPYI